MIDFDRLDRDKELLRKQFLSAKPFPHIAIDDFLVSGEADKLYDNLPSPTSESKSRDYIFAKNKLGAALL